MTAYAYTPYLWPIIGSAVCVAVLSGYSWRRRTMPSALPLAVLTFFFWPWVVGTGLELAAQDPSLKFFWVKFQAVWQLPTATAVLWFAMEYANLDRWMNRTTTILLSVPPILVLLLVLTNDVHHLIWIRSPLGGLGSPARGSWNWVFTGYGLALILIGSGIFIWLFVRSPLHRCPVALCLFGQLLTRTAYLFDAFDAELLAPMQLTILAGTFTCAMYALALFHFGVFDLVPIARATMIEQMREGILVLDAQRRVVDLNHAAEEILDICAAEARGRNAVQVLPSPVDLDALLAGPGTAPSEFCTGSGDTARSYALQFSPLKYRRGMSLGSLIHFHETTEHKRAERERLEQQRALAALQERHRVARELHDSLGQVLGYVKLQTQAARELLNQNRQSAADGHLAQLAAVVQEAHADVREYILGARADFAAEAGFFSVVRQYLQQFSENFGIATQLDVTPDLANKLEPTAEAQVLRVIQEALTNVRKHARADSVSVSFSLFDGYAQAVIRDNGQGFNPALFETAEGQKFGLRFMRERAEEVGGSLRIHSAPGEGTQVIVLVPARGAS